MKTLRQKYAYAGVYQKFAALIRPAHAQQSGASNGPIKQAEALSSYIMCDWLVDVSVFNSQQRPTGYATGRRVCILRRHTQTILNDGKG